LIVIDIVLLKDGIGVWGKKNGPVEADKPKDNG